jgi:hypothetical protein
VGSEILTGEVEQVKILLREMIAVIRLLPGCIFCPIIFIIEGVALDPMYMCDTIRPFKNLCIMKEVANGDRYGVPKTRQSTITMRFLLGVAMSKRTIRFIEGAIPINSGYCKEQRTIAMLRNELSRQLHSYNQDKITGKMSGKEFGPDDLAIVLMMSIYWPMVFCESSRMEYAPFQK